MKVLIVGSKGMLGSALLNTFTDNSNYDAVGLDIEGIDITDIESVRTVISEVKPDILINAAAYTAVDIAESEEEVAEKVNSEGVRNLAKCCKDNKIKMVHYSTDFVFDGEGSAPYKEDDPTNPIGVYGATKLSGELALSEETEDFIIIRTAWLYGPGGNNFVTAIMNKIKTSKELKVVCDQYGAPTYTLDLAQATINLLEKEASGVFHFSNDAGVRGMSWHEFAVGIWGQMVIRDMPYTIALVDEVSTEEYPTPAKRPKYSVLDTTKYSKTTGVKPPDWKEALVRYFDKLPKTFSDI